MMKVYFVFMVLGLLILALDIFATVAGWKVHRPHMAVVEAGVHAGKVGYMVSIPWFGNGYNTRVRNSCQ